MAKGKDILTTGDVAKICHVAPRTVSKWFDNGQLKGYRIPGSKDRRIPMSELIRFMKVYNMPTEGLLTNNLRILVADSNQQAANILADAIHEKAGYEVQTVYSSFQAGSVIQSFAPHVLLISLLADGINAAEVCKGIRVNENTNTIKVIAIANQLNNSEVLALLHKGFDDYISYGSDIVEVIKKIEDATSIIY